MDPTIAQLQLPVLVAADRTSTTGVIERVSTDCKQVGRTTAGTVLCLSTSRGVLTASRLGRDQGSFAANAFEVFGNVVWLESAAPRQLVRLEDVDGGLRNISSVPLSDLPDRLRFTDERAVVRDDAVLEALDDGGVSSTPLVQANRFQAVVIDDRAVVGVRRDGSLCDALSPTCEDPTGNAADVLEWDGTQLWLEEPGSMAAVERPLLQPSARRLAVSMPQGFETRDGSPVFEAKRLSRRPLVLEARFPRKSFVLRLRVNDGAASLEAFRGGTGIISVTRDWLVVRTSPTEAAFIRWAP